ncbi:MAG: riboflavin synthase [Proteobacteria bacterium]|nr:riboflavin synthase [Pseudomonadota bacterium]
MFTGIIEEVGIVRSLSSMGADQLELRVGCSGIQDDLKIGDSVAVDGVCLTVVRFDGSQIDFELSSETYKTSLFPSKRNGMKVNLERALRLADRLGGHLVQGHVDCRSKVIGVQKMGGFYEIDFSLDPEVEKYVVHKGSITVNGISLTVAALKEREFKVAVIPHTFRQTSLSELNVGNEVHIETDVVARYIERLLPFQETSEHSKMTYDFLKQHGF